MHEDKKNILLITFDNWGYNQYIADALEKKSYRVKHVNFHSFEYTYPDFTHKAFNFITKNLGIVNLKHIHYNDIITDEIKNINNIETVIYIKADFLSKQTIETINQKAKKSVLLINDSINRYPNTKNILGLFDKVFSFERKDCDKYDLIFKPNFIYKTIDKIPKHFKYKVFNISSYDKRFPVIKKIAEALYDLNIKSKIVIFSSKENNDPYLEFSKCTLSISEINALMEESEIILDVNRNQQEGLSFRVFESLGLKKKLITTNPDIVTYDFYNPENIFVIEDVDNIKIPQSFLQSPYKVIPQEILDKYLVENWVDELIN
ncbi:23S rRNA U2552 (ribose-2'-O)-methylase RlmE/FtsJ [Epilithonimonas hungarica]|uniref:hypothetical protein n=1 Tax=Epilithonimonas hungarica TaxID=454006 RepID=UPI0027849F10|nr:hypothetical protein [Epilithonimonas hungarica]MDP9957806.1 23S rRNA U2552 (ribose-2'-O)-methylase RlmE/FtsJ [Epilithonimonas hungarica]